MSAEPRAPAGGSLTDRIFSEIRTRGPITFARFMELALYEPEVGYYERGAQAVGRAGDYYTSVSVGRVFGEMLAFQACEWLATAGPGPRRILEAGAHDGRLAQDVLDWVRLRRPEMWDAFEYWILEPSPRRRGWQEERLRGFGRRVRWCEDWADVGEFRGVVWANELLDAFPVHRLAWNAQGRAWGEWHVGIDQGRLGWVRGGLSAELRRAVSLPPGGEANPVDDRLRAMPPELAAVLPDAYTTEVCPAAADWWARAARALRWGWLMTLDYGLERDEYLAPWRSGGTLRAYSAHQVHSDLLEMPGDRDLTAHVDFSTIRAVGEALGLSTDYAGRQGSFLARVLAEMERDPGRFEGWSGNRRRQLQTLMHPTHLGRAFMVLVQARRTS